MSEVVPHFRYGSIRLDEYPYSVIREEGGVDIGTAEPEMEEIQTLLANGGVLLSSRTNNRTLTVSVNVEGGSLHEVAQAAAALYAECRKDYNEFSLTPGGLGAETVFDTYAATATSPRDDTYESALIRRIDLTIPAGPWSRSATSTVETAVYDADDTNYQHPFTIPISGAAPTEGSLHISHASSALGNFLLYTCPQMVPDYLPNLRQYATSATVSAATTDSSVVSGAWNPLSTTDKFVAEIPSDNIPPGSYAIWAYVRSNTTGSYPIFCSTYIKHPLGVLLGSVATSYLSVDLVANQWTAVPVTRTQLPSMRLQTPGSSTSVAVEISAVPGGASIRCAEVWVFNTTIGALTAGIPSGTKNVWVDSPTVTAPTQAVRLGLNTDGSDSFGGGPFLTAWGTHILEPPAIRGLLVTSTAVDASLTLTHSARWPDYAAD